MRMKCFQFHFRKHFCFCVKSHKKEDDLFQFSSASPHEADLIHFGSGLEFGRVHVTRSLKSFSSGVVRGPGHSEMGGWREHRYSLSGAFLAEQWQWWRAAWAWVQVLPGISCVALGISLHFSVPWFPHLSTEDSNSPSHRVVLWINTYKALTLE